MWLVLHAALLCPFLHSVIGHSVIGEGCPTNKDKKTCDEYIWSIGMRNGIDESRLQKLTYPPLHTANCYIMVNEPMNFTSASQVCRNSGGQLAWTPHRDSCVAIGRELKHNSLIPHNANLYAYVGLVRESGDWIWQCATNKIFHMPAAADLHLVTSQNSTNISEVMLAGALNVTDSGEYGIAAVNATEEHPFFCQLYFGDSAGTTNSTNEGPDVVADISLDICFSTGNAYCVLMLIGWVLTMVFFVTFNINCCFYIDTRAKFNEVNRQIEDNKDFEQVLRMVTAGKDPPFSPLPPQKTQPRPM